MIYKINEDVLSEQFDGEVVIINLKTGNYFSLAGSAANIWDWIGKGTPIEAIDKHIAEYYQVEETEVSQSTHLFIDELLKDDLIIRHEIDQKSVQNRINEIVLPPLEGDPTFVPPKLERYTDMQALLLLDPIHDVSEEGWPHLPPEEDNLEKRD